MSKVNLNLRDYVTAGYPAILFKTSEEERALEECLDICNSMEDLKMYVWSLTKGICEVTKKVQRGEEKITSQSIGEEISPDEEVLKKGISLNDNNGNYVYCVLDFHPFIKQPTIWRTAKDVFQQAKTMGITYIFISNNFDVPPELEHEIIIHDMRLPNKEELKELANEMAIENGINRNISSEDIEKASLAALGLTMMEAENAFATTISKVGILDLQIINSVKQQIICKDGLLECQSAEETIDTVGGMKSFTEYAIERFSAYSEEAQEYGLPYPKGVLLVGIPGCGKSLASKALANMWNVPLVKLDLGKLFGSYVGDTESNTRKAIKIAEAMAPCVLWLDEIDKGFSGVGSTGDSGVTSRMFGAILTWLQEKTSPVYVIATANNISALPQELLRKGRFDEIFFVDLPDEEERKEIFSIQIKKHKGNPENFDIEKLSSVTDGYNGSEIEECVISAMFHAWNDGKRPYTTSDIEDALNSLKPASSGIMGDTVKSLRKWSSDNSIRRANSKPKEVSSNHQEDTVPQGKRVIRSAN